MEHCKTIMVAWYKGARMSFRADLTRNSISSVADYIYDLQQVIGPQRKCDFFKCKVEVTVTTFQGIVKITCDNYVKCSLPRTFPKVSSCLVSMVFFFLKRKLPDLNQTRPSDRLLVDTLSLYKTVTFVCQNVNFTHLKVIFLSLFLF